MISLNARIGLGAGLVLAVFVGLTAWALDRAFEESASDAMRQRLSAQAYLLMAAAEVNAQGQLLMPRQLTESRFNLPESGLYAAIAVGSRAQVWRSASSAGLSLPLKAVLKPGTERFTRRAGAGKSAFHVLSVAVEWEIDGRSIPLTFSVAEDLAPYQTQMNGYRRSLWGWLGAMAVLLLITQTLLLRWGLRPLRSVGAEIVAIEQGRQERINKVYPKELQPLTGSLNALLKHERRQLSRYKDGLADLAHSLKTPLAILRGLRLQQDPVESSVAALEEQVARMDGIIAYQLQRAVTAGRSALASPVAVGVLVQRVADTLQKVYREKGVQLQVQIDETISLRAEEGDLMEVFGNLLDNAAKWCTSQVVVRAERFDGRVRFCIEDDGPGVAPEQAERMLSRGVRLDESTPGHGIGMAIVRDIVQAYEGHLEIAGSALGGAKVCVSFVLR